ncbi:MAG: hypothetical protein JW881_09445 [Spirochaetales bacterium]|nr:hypothetical protein [Spirochaetales bacterium]
MFYDKKRMGVILFLTLSLVTIPAFTCSSDFSEALQQSVYVYDADKYGPGVTGGLVEWLSGRHTEGEFRDGFHDAGDRVTFGLLLSRHSPDKGFSYNDNGLPEIWAALCHNCEWQ